MSLPTLSGTARLTADPELRFGTSGVAVAKINLAFNSRKLDRETNQWVDDSVFFVTGTLFKQAAENACESLSRGDEVVVTGRLKTRQWETPEGEKRSTVELLLDSIGPSLRFATAKVNKTARSGEGSSSGSSAPADDPWAAAAPGSGSGQFTEEPPF